MSDTAIDCPECGRTFPEASNLQGHVNASTDHPSWAAIQNRLDDEGIDPPDEGGEAGDGRDPETDPEGASEGPEGAGSEGGSTPSEETTDEETDDEGAEPGDGRESTTGPEGPQEGAESAPEEDDMPTDEELERQRAQLNGGSEGGSSPSEEETDDEGGKAGDGRDPEADLEGPKGALSGAVGALVPSVDKTTIVLLLGLALVLALLYRYMGDDESGTTQETEPVSDAEIDADQDGGESNSGGGLIAADEGAVP